MKKKVFTLLLALFAIAMTAQAENTINGREYVDLGLPSGTLWATCNVGASKPEEYGLYFAWGETTGYTSDTSDGHSFDWEYYKWCNGDYNKLTKYCFKSRYGNYGNNGFTDNKTELDLEDDAAYVNWGSNWRMPSRAQQDELREKCTWTRTTYKGVIGYIVKGKNGNSVFLPAAGYRYLTGLSRAGYSGYYWSRSLNKTNPSTDRLVFYPHGASWGGESRCKGLSVRPVRRKN